MQEGKKIGMVGGDGRMGAAFRVLLRAADEGVPGLRGAEFALWGAGFRDACAGESGARGEDLWEAGSFVHGRRAVRCADPESAVREADAVILPLPVSRDGIRLNAPGMGDDALRVPEHLRVTELLGLMKPGATVFGGRIPETAREVCRERGLFAVDYFEDEAFQIRNAVPTAEGAVAACIDALPVTVAGLSCTVLGYGRVGRTLAKRLSALGADVTAAARSPRDLAWAESDGCVPVPLAEWRDNPPEHRAVFNTVPAKILEADTLGRMKRGTVLFDLAPGSEGSVCCGRDEAERAGIRVIALPSLPGKCAPETAGEIIGGAVLAALAAREGGGV